MMRVFRLLAAALGVALCAGLAGPPRVDYTLTPVLEGSGALRALQVDVRFRGEPDGETGLRLPEAWGGQEELWKGIDALSVVTGAELRPGDGPAHRVLTHEPGARIHVRYRIVQDWPGEPGAGQGNTYRPTIQPTYFHIIGSAAFVLPELDDATIVRVRARNLPRNWTFASDLLHAPVNLARVPPSVVVGGDFRILRAGDPNVRVAIRGQWSFTDAEFAAQVAEIIAGQRALWGDASSPFLVTVLQLSAPDPGWTSIGGTGLGDAFAFFATPNAPANPLTRTLAHEGLHTWIPGRIGGSPDEGEAAQYWLSEGFTDFYTGRMLVRDGQWSPAEFAADLNEMLTAYARSPVLEEPNSRILADFWNDQDVQKLPYQRGRLLATIWDARLRALSERDLDDVMLEMQARARVGDPLKAIAMFPIVAEAMGLEVSADIAAHIEQGRPIQLPEDVFAPCGRIVTREVPTFHRGFDIQATQANNNTIAGVVVDGPAYAAGMRDGMLLLRREAGEIGNSELEIAYVVRDGETERTFRYIPRGSAQVTQQTFVLDPTLDEARLAQCVRVLSGA